MFEIFIEDGFAAAHNLRNYNGKCENLHGHNYRVRIFISGGDLDNSGMLLDFSALKKNFLKITEKLDHKYLNEIRPFDRVNPTAENLAKYLYSELKKTFKSRRFKVTKVAVWETDTNCATYYE